MPRKLSSFDDLAAVFGNCQYLQNIFVTRGFVFLPPFFGRGETTQRTWSDYCCAKAELLHAASTAATIAVGLKIVEGSSYGRVVTLRDAGLPEKNAVIFNEVGSGWQMAILTESHAPEWFDHLVQTLKSSFANANELQGLHTWTIPDIEAALEIAIHALRARSGAKSKAN